MEIKTRWGPGVAMAVSGTHLSCKQFPGDNFFNYPPALELLCEMKLVALIYPMLLGIIMIWFYI
jgi:hypothetical protein